jgi:hypothetical protein
MVFGPLSVAVVLLHIRAGRLMVGQDLRLPPMLERGHVFAN